MKETFLEDFGKAIAAAASSGFLFHLVRIPLVLGYLIVGVLIGPHIGLSVISDSENIKYISEVGLILLMFILGIEIDIRKIVQLGRTILVTAWVQIIGSFVLGASLFYFFGLAQNKNQMVYFGVVSTLSSTLIVIKILSEKMDLESIPSQVTIGALVIQDLAAVAFLAIQPNLSHLELTELLGSLGRVFALVASGIVASKWILPIVFHKSSKQSELIIILAMGWCFSMCGLASFLRLSPEMGALIAGVSIASFPIHLDIGARISSLRDFFLTLFFVGLGLQIPTPTANIFFQSLILVGIVYLTRFITIFPMLYKLKFGVRTSFLPALNLSQISEFSIVLAGLGITYGHIDDNFFSMVIIAMVISFLISSFAISNSFTAFQKINPLFRFFGIDDVGSFNLEAKKDKKFKYIFLGFHRESSSLLFELEQRYGLGIKSEILIVDFNPDTHKQLKIKGYECVYGDLSSHETLMKIDLTRGQFAISTISDHYLKGTSNLKLLKAIKQLAPDTKTILVADKQSLAHDLYRGGADLVLYPRMWTSRHFADALEAASVEGFSQFRTEFDIFFQDRNEIVN